MLWGDRRHNQADAGELLRDVTTDFKPPCSFSFTVALVPDEGFSAAAPVGLGGGGGGGSRALRRGGAGDSRNPTEHSFRGRGVFGGWG